MNLTGLSEFLLANGAWGAIVLYLLWDRQEGSKRLEACQRDVMRMLEEVTKVVSSSTEAMRSNTLAQERATEAQRSTAEGVRALQAVIGTLDKAIERLETRERNA